LLRRIEGPKGHGAWGMGHGAERAWGMGHWAERAWAWGDGEIRKIFITPHS